MRMKARTQADPHVNTRVNARSDAHMERVQRMQVRGIATAERIREL